jgi:Short-chain dehydrogenases of various substrate specificities
MVETRRVLITGGTRGLGRCLAAEFSRRGCEVFITGRAAAAASAAAAELAVETGGALFSGSGDVSSWDDLKRLASEAKAAMGGIDIWINNAGVNQSPGMVWELEAADMERVVRTDLLGAMLGAKAAFDAMGDTGGWLWFVEGHGSDGRVIPGLSAYGSAKRGLAYLWRALAAEAASTGSKLKVGAISPGIMVTDFILDNLRREAPDKRRRTIAAYNALADRPETVASFLVPRMLAAKKSGVLIAWLTNAKVAWRFMSAAFSKRRMIED